MDSSSECILIPEKQICSRELSSPVRNYGEYDFDFYFLQKYMNDHEDKFRNIYKFRYDLFRIFNGNYILGPASKLKNDSIPGFLKNVGIPDSLTKKEWNRNGLDGLIFGDSNGAIYVMVPLNRNRNDSNSISDKPILIRATTKYRPVRM
jgi:hypothetical protein